MFRLCLSLGVIHPDLLLPRLTWQQIEDWRTYYDCEPWGEVRADLRLENQRLLSEGRVYETGAPPNAVWPYYEAEKHDLNTLLELITRKKRNG